MTPRDFLYYVSYTDAANPVNHPYAFISHARVERPYFKNLRTFKFSKVLALTAGGRILATALGVPVKIILTARTKPKMMRVATAWVVARVTHAQMAWIYLIMNKVRESVCQDYRAGSPANFHTTVAKLIFAAGPFPTLVRAAFGVFKAKACEIVRQQGFHSFTLISKLSHSEGARRACMRQAFGATLAAQSDFSKFNRGLQCPHI